MPVASTSRHTASMPVRSGTSERSDERERNDAISHGRPTEHTSIGASVKSRASHPKSDARRSAVRVVACASGAPIVIVKSVFLRDIGAAALLSNLWPLLVIATGTLSAANWMFRRRLA